MTAIRIVRGIIRRIIYIPHTILWYLPWGFSHENRKRLCTLKNIHKGKRCFVIANGPSLKKIDFNLLRNEITIGMNRIYLLEEKIGFLPTYLMVFDIPYQIKQFASEFENIKTTKIYNWIGRRYFNRKSDINYFYSHFKLDFSPDFTKRVGNGKSVMISCIQLAYYLGFKEVYIIGKDHHYNTSAKPGSNIKADGMEQNHFIAGYYKEGQNWGAPHLGEEEYSYNLAKIAFEKDDRMVFDATIEGKLQIFKKVDFYSLFSKKAKN